MTVFFTISYVILGLLGLGLSIAPLALLDLYGASTDETGEIALRGLGVLALVLALSLRSSQNHPYHPTSRALYGWMTLGSIALAALATVGLALGTLSTFGWVTIIVFGVLALGFGSWFMRSLTRRETNS